MKHLEDKEQEIVFSWAAYIPKLKWMYAIANGGRRDKREASRLKAQGVKAGVSDIFLPLPMDDYHGLYIELKRRKTDGRSKVSAKQSEFQEDMKDQGYRCEVCYGADEAIAIIKEYARI